MFIQQVYFEIGAGWPSTQPNDKMWHLKNIYIYKYFIDGLESRTFYVSKLSVTAKLYVKCYLFLKTKLYTIYFIIFV